MVPNNSSPSPLELRDPGYLDRLQREGAAQRTLVQLTSLGINIALDDFGTGFASLDLLAATPASTLKLDRSFIASVGDESEAVRGRAVIVQAAIGLGRSLGLDIVAEGIETPVQARTLLAWGCQFGQGYHYSRPVAGHDLDLRTASRKRPLDLTQPVPSGRLLSAESIDLALALTTAFRATDADGGRQRSDAVAVAGVIEHVLGSGRDHADAAVLLAAIGDATERLQALAPVDEGSNLATQDLLAALAVPPIISRHTPPGAVARTAWALAAARASGTAAYDPSLLAAHPDPSVDAALRDRGGISTLIDVGDLAEWEEIRPTDELYATTAADQRSFTLADGPTLSAVASFVGIAITRVEDVGPGTSCW